MYFSLNGNTVIGYIVSYTEIIIIYAKRKDLKIEAIVYDGTNMFIIQTNLVLF